jgi:hypothetical protein
MTTKIEINGCKILKHGIKSPSGKYVPAWYSHATLTDGREAVTVYAKRCKSLPKELGSVENNSDMMTDYHEADKCRFFAGTPEFDKMILAAASHAAA